MTLPHLKSSTRPAENERMNKILINKTPIAKTLIAAGLLLFAFSTGAAQAQDAPHIVYPKQADSEFRLIDPISAATATGADQVAREDTHRAAAPQVKAPVVYFHRKGQNHTAKQKS